MSSACSRPRRKTAPRNGTFTVSWKTGSGCRSFESAPVFQEAVDVPISEHTPGPPGIKLVRRRAGEGLISAISSDSALAHRLLYPAQVSNREQKKNE
jgi:hypothetical protein